MLHFSRIRLLLLLVLVSVLSSTATQTASAQDNLIGKWNVVAETPEGENKSVWTFSESGGKVTGQSLSEETGETADFEAVEANGNSVKFSIDVDYQGTSLLLDLEVKLSDDNLTGTWIALGPDGNEVATGGLSGTKVAQKTDKSMFVGNWDSIAVLPDGTESESLFTITKEDGKLSGSLDGANGKVDFDEVSVSKGKLMVAFQLEVQGAARNIEVEAKKKDDGTLEGEWILVVGEDEAATGPWSAKKRTETEILFGGKNLDNFRGYKEEAIGKGWKVVDGMLHFDGTRSGDIITKKEYGSFELTFDWKVSEGGNSGVMYRVTLGDNAPYFSGIEYQVLDNEKHNDGKKRVTSAASLYALYPPGDAQPKKPGEWNSSKIVIDGDKVQHWLNGAKVVDVEIDSDDWKKRVSESKFAKWEKFGKSKRGHIAFQDHSDPVWYRNIKIKPMD